MKILREGNLKKNRPDIFFHCYECGCEFIAESGEYQYAVTSYNESYYSCKCPYCGNKAYGSETQKCPGG